MADTFQLGTLSADGKTFTSLRDFNTGDIQLVRDTFSVGQPQRKQQFTDTNRRYGGSRVSSETHDNGSIGGSFLVAGSSANDSISRWEAIISEIESATAQYYVKWQPQSASNPVFYEVRGPATWTAKYRWIEFQAASKTIVFDIVWPVAPLARGLTVDASFAVNGTATTASTSITTPASSYANSGASALTLTSVPGTAPALLDLQVEPTTETDACDWAMIGWTANPSSPLSSSVVPFGIIDCDNASYISAGDLTYDSTDATAHNSTKLKKTTSATAGTKYSFTVSVDPSTIQRDAFTAGDLSLEVWARVYTPASTTAAVTVTASLEPDDGVGQSRFTMEYGSAGKQLQTHTSAGWRMYRLGTLSGISDPSAARIWKLKVAYSLSATATTEVSFDHLIVVPSRQRALSPSGKELDTTFPSFVKAQSAGATTAKKLIKADLSGWVRTSSSQFYPDSGLGGQMLEVDPGTSRLFIKLTAAVPDDPTPAVADSVNRTIKLTGSITPRYYLARGS